jgi:microcystin-dependent protein
MAEPFLAEIQIYPFNFPPRGWAFCNGQLMPISQNTALFALLGTIYGGDGKSTFALPDIQGKVVVQPGQGAGLADRLQGEEGGAEFVTLLESEMPAHAHALRVSPDDADLSNPLASRSLARSAGGFAYAATPNTAMAPQALAPAGGDLPHNNMQPYLVLHFCIALQGVFPPRWPS